MTRILNVTAIDSCGNPTTTQLLADTNDGIKPAIDWMEDAMRREARRGTPLIAAFVYDAHAAKLHRYLIDNNRAVLTSGKVAPR